MLFGPLAADPVGSRSKQHHHKKKPAAAERAKELSVVGGHYCPSSPSSSSSRTTLPSVKEADSSAGPPTTKTHLFEPSKPPYPVAKSPLHKSKRAPVSKFQIVKHNWAHGASSAPVDLLLARPASSNKGSSSSRQSSPEKVNNRARVDHQHRTHPLEPGCWIPLGDGSLIKALSAEEIDRHFRAQRSARTQQILLREEAEEARKLGGNYRLSFTFDFCPIKAQALFRMEEEQPTGRTPEEIPGDMYW